ncbi:MAG TPA: ferritin-like domain-containing protein [Anditalea sp.]|nr:ferritin-like domain-containing protein [Anditalea sp.]
MKNANEGKFEELFKEQLKDIYWAENHLLKALPKMKDAASTPTLREAIGDHMKETENQIKRLEKIFENLGMDKKGKKCEAMEGLLEEADEMLDEFKNVKYVKDAAIIMAAQKIEHYEIATYGTLCNMAKIMGNDNVTQLLEETLKEEKHADELLTKIAVEEVNEEAMQEG